MEIRSWAEEALYREMLEESGLTNLLLTMKLGVQYYYKAFIDSNVERHDFLAVPDRKLPEEWEYIGTGDGGYLTMIPYNFIKLACRGTRTWPH
ncbi:protein of unknown function [Paenibacillus alvei]|uniref:Nudix hydrolase domain-containing protein n=1 Tax=Paenibacillus alvei TaxID=44250 RepID=A0A383RBR1_PAEAL|nr:protein of unknown function [Paenibacillus alvei]